ncbi:esterase FE4-like [Anopheles albimanus]|uniref:Carboxylic ester hydrolase n=1 Tax=Anopheles albimanus TaxID=7167 RepID=A0A182FLE8_ANOAL|nr:esterase FE4-like [Anopheles albimanus]
MEKCGLVFLVFALLGTSHSLPENPPIVHTTHGAIEGTVLQSRLGQSFYAFRGIPYAQSPTGDLRFQPPVPLTEPWNGTYDATEDGPMCPQPFMNDTYKVSEDCLRLNVYTPAIPGELIRIQPRDVLVYLHPGGFYSLSGQSNTFAGPHAIMDHPIVFVTINYRLGSLGFTSTGTAECPGNVGLKDQVAALRWIQQNIAGFGGRPDSVTLMGYSAGAISTALHLISPMSKRLFHRAIVMSGAPTAQWDVPEHQLELAQKQAVLLGCPITTVTEMMECLRQKPSEDFADSLESMFVLAWNPVLLWKPVIEPDFGQERFLDRNPTEAFQKGDFTKVPVIAGITRDEFAGPAVTFLRNETLRRELDSSFETLAPILFQFERHTPESVTRSRLLRERFLGSSPLTLNDSLTGLNYLFADGLIGFGMHRFIALASKFTTVYQYKFAYVGRYSHLYYPGDKPYGAAHHDDLIYLLTGPFIAPMFNRTDPEHETVVRLTSMWTSFAIHGDPNRANLPGLQWNPITTENDTYLEIGNHLETKQGLFTERFSFWEQLFPLSPLSTATDATE